MKYDITKPTAPMMPNLGRGTECIKLLLSQASKDVQKPFVLMFFPLFGALLGSAKIQHPGLIWEELCRKMHILWPNVRDISSNCSIL